VAASVHSGSSRGTPAAVTAGVDSDGDSEAIPLIIATASRTPSLLTAAGVTTAITITIAASSIAIAVTTTTAAITAIVNKTLTSDKISVDLLPSVATAAANH
jgi:hypothetical protein